MIDALINFFSKFFAEETYCKVISVDNTTLTKVVEAGDTDIKCKAVEIKNRSGVDVIINPNDSADSFPLANGEDRIVYTRLLSRLKIARASGSGSVNIHLIYEN